MIHLKSNINAQMQNWHLETRRKAEIKTERQLEGERDKDNGCDRFIGSPGVKKSSPSEGGAHTPTPPGVEACANVCLCGCVCVTQTQDLGPYSINNKMASCCGAECMCRNNHTHIVMYTHTHTHTHTHSSRYIGISDSVGLWEDHVPIRS